MTCSAAGAAGASIWTGRPSTSWKARPERLMPLLDVGDHPIQHVGVDAALNLHRTHQVIGRGLGSSRFRNHNPNWVEEA